MIKAIIFPVWAIALGISGIAFSTTLPTNNMQIGIAISAVFIAFGIGGIVFVLHTATRSRNETKDKKG